MSQSDEKCRIMARTQLTITPKSVTITAVIRVVAQRLSVPVWGTGGRRFKSAQPDFFRLFLTAAAIVQRLIISASCLFPPFLNRGRCSHIPDHEKEENQKEKNVSSEPESDTKSLFYGIIRTADRRTVGFITCPEIDSDTAFKHKKNSRGQQLQKEDL